MTQYWLDTATLRSTYFPSTCLPITFIISLHIQLPNPFWICPDLDGIVPIYRCYQVYKYV